jgi:hypothetical protein
MAYGLIVGFILFTPFYAFLMFIYLRIILWERSITRMVSDPRYRDDVKKIANITENILAEHAIPVIIDKIDTIIEILQREFSRLRCRDPALAEDCGAGGR